MDEIKIHGVTIKKSPVSPTYNAEKHCLYLDNGICLTCDCDECSGGQVIERVPVDQGLPVLRTRECECVKRAKNQKRIRDSGLEQLGGRCTFEAFETSKPWQQALKLKARDYLNDRKTMSFFVSGQSGSGKTHIVTAIACAIMNSGEELKYFQWVEDGTRMKQLITERELYEQQMALLVKIPYLVVDDLFKQAITSADIRLFHEMLNGRYIRHKPVIISSERSLSYIREAQNGDGGAIAGRIFEMCGKGEYCFEVKGREKDQRFYGSRGARPP